MGEFIYIVERELLCHFNQSTHQVSSPSPDFFFFLCYCNSSKISLLVTKISRYLNLVTVSVLLLSIIPSGRLKRVQKARQKMMLSSSSPHPHSSCEDCNFIFLYFLSKSEICIKKKSHLFFKKGRKLNVSFWWLLV